MSSFPRAFWLAHLLLCSSRLAFGDEPILNANWNPKQAGDRVLAGLVNVSAPAVKGAHDSELLFVDKFAYVLSLANDQQASEDPRWPFIYVTLSVVDWQGRKVEKYLSMARGGQVFDNETLPEGSCFVPRMIRKSATTLRCFFASESPGKRQSQMWHIDFDLGRQAFDNRIFRTKLKTAAGTFDMQPQYFHADAAAHGFERPAVDYGLYFVDSFKSFGSKIYAVINNFPGGQNALAVANDELDTFEVLGHYNVPAQFKLTESAANQLPDGTWLAICRQEGGAQNYTFSTSRDGRDWTSNDYRPFVPNGASSKPAFERFRGVYYLGWQELTKIKGVNRSVFNLEVSRDGKSWERKYRFETEHSFQYPTFRLHDNKIFLTVTQGDSSPSRKERIMFGLLE